MHLRAHMCAFECEHTSFIVGLFLTARATSWTSSFPIEAMRGTAAAPVVHSFSAILEAFARSCG